MQILSYSPSVEAYALVGKDRKPVDLSRDITSCTVNRKVDAASQFSITLQNKGWKYNGLFSPMDPIVIYSTKSDRQKLFTGYITSMDAYRLYQSDFNISGFCPIYRLQNLYWDPILYESQMLVRADAYRNGKQDNGYAMVASRLLETVGGMSADAIHIQENIPDDALKFAQEMYQANLDSANQLRSMVDDFYSVLQTHGPKASGFVVVDSGAGEESDNGTGIIDGGSHEDGSKYHQKQKNGHNCGATSVAVGINILIGQNRFDGLKVWESPQMDRDTTRYDLIDRTKKFIEANGLGDRLTVYAMPGGRDTHDRSKYREVLQKGHIIISSSGANSQFRHKDGTWAYHGGHWVCFYHYADGKYYSNDSSKYPSKGAGAPYTEKQMQQWLDGRDIHCAFVIAPKSGYSGAMSADQRKIVEKASNGSVTGTPGYCAQWVSMVWSACGFPYPSGNAIDFWNQWKSTGSKNIATAPPGAVMCGSGSGDAGSLYGHVGIRLTGDKVASIKNGSTPTIETVKSFYSWQTATCQGHKGSIGWCVPPGPSFSKKS